MKTQLSKSNGNFTPTIDQNRYAMILAGGDGTRLQCLTRTISGDERPKQFCRILNNETLLMQTRRRVKQKIAPERTYFVLTKNHEQFFQPMLLDVNSKRKIIQSENKGTAPAILLSLLKLPRNATVAFFPSDHYFADEVAFMDYVEAAYASAELPAQPIVLVGIEPQNAETSYGWIEPVRTVFGTGKGKISRVRRFWEKPSRDKANQLLTQGCLWNSFVMVGNVQKFLDMFKKSLPDLYRLLEPSQIMFGTKAEEILLRETYKEIKETNFCSEVLEKCAHELCVLNVGNVGWSDWGEPQRVLGTLAQLGIRTDWMAAAAL